MKTTKAITTMAIGLSLLLGAAGESRAVCLLECDSSEVPQAPATDSNNAYGAENESQGRASMNTQANNNKGVVLSGVNMQSHTSANVGTNNGDISVSSGHTIIGAMTDNSSKNNVGNK